MSLWRRECVHVGIAARHIVCSAGTAPGAGRTLIDFDMQRLERETDAAQRLAAALDEAINTHMRRPNLQVVVSCEVSRHWTVEPPAGLASLRELGAVAEARFATLFAADPARWSLTGDWHADRPSLCAAVPRALVEGLQRLHAQRGIDYVIDSALGAVLERHRRAMASRWCVIRMPRTLILIQSNRGSPCSIRLIPCRVDGGSDARVRAAAVELRRELLRHGDPPEQSVAWLDFAASREHATEATSLDLDGIRFCTFALPQDDGRDALDLMIEAESRSGQSKHAAEAVQ